MMETLNRAFLYGESVFTSFILKGGVPIDWGLHFERLKLGVDFVYGPFQEEEDWAVRLKNRLEQTLANEQGDKVIRLTIYLDHKRGLRHSGINSVMDLHLHLRSGDYQPNSKTSMKMRTCSGGNRPDWWPSFLKSGSYLETILAQRKFLQPGDDDLIFLGPNQSIRESSVANLFMVKNNKLYTPQLGPHVLAGIMRKKIIENCLDLFDEINEAESNLEQLLKADLIFGSNSLKGAFLIDRIDSKELNIEAKHRELIVAINQRVFLNEKA